MPVYQPGRGKTGRINPTNKLYHPTLDPASIAIPRWAKNIIARHASQLHKSNAQFVCEWAERLDAEGGA